jgi:diguanylate cyclase (GGDEF)-like protein
VTRSKKDGGLGTGARVQALGHGEARPAGGATNGAAPRPRVLLVEDDPDTREILAELLGARFDVLCASTAEEALAIALERGLEGVVAVGGGIDVVVADVVLPKLNGLGLLEALQRGPQTTDLPVVFLSGRAEERLVVDCLERGAADFIAKPPACRELIARIDRVLRERGRRVRLETLARTDALTGLPNFRALTQKLDEEFHRATRYHHPVSVVMIDVDHLKEVNDRLGHSVGNQALAAVGRMLTADLRQADFAARYGGDEFVVLLPHQAPSDAETFAERVRAHLGGLQILDERGGLLDLKITSSFGVAGLNGAVPFEGGAALLRAADLALYEAKRRGRNQVALYGREVAAGAASLHPHA